MKNLTLFLFVFVALKLQSGIRETFSDGNFTDNPPWSGNVSVFKINQSYQLQSAAINAGNYSLFTPSVAIYNAVWEFCITIDYATSSSNFASVFIISDQSAAESGLNGYFVQIGNTSDEVSLYCQEGFKKTKIIDGTDKRTDGKTVDIKVKVTRDNKGKFELFTKLKSETEYFPEGFCYHSGIQKSGYFGLSYSCTASTGTSYFFDDILIEGTEIPDTIQPVWKHLRVFEENKLQLSFSEPVKIGDFQLTVDDEIQPVSNIFSHPGDTLITITPVQFPSPHKRHIISVSGISDFNGNKLTASTKLLVLSELPMSGDFYFNEIMFNPNDSSAEYLEIFNLTEKLLDLSGLIITTMKTDGSFQTGKSIPDGTFLEPNAYIAFTQDSGAVKKFHQCPDSARIIQMPMYVFSNEAGTVACFDKTSNLVYDELKWDDSMHHVLIKNAKGISLEKSVANVLSSETNNWHSSSTIASGGTPGYQNSQYMEVINNADDVIRVNDDFFTPDNDGDRDIFLIKLRFDEPGYMISAVVFSHSGEKVKNILLNQLGSTENFISWDGSNNHNQVVSPGIYSVFIEYFHPLTGKRSTSGIPVAVAFR